MFWLARDATSSLSLAVFVSFYNIDIMGSQEESIRLIQLYSTYKALWDPKDPKYLNKNQREDSWRQISAQMNMSVKEVKKKMDSLCGSYRREKSREKKSRITGSGMYFYYYYKLLFNLQCHYVCSGGILQLNFEADIFNRLS
jgi:hypothetical protein